MHKHDPAHFLLFGATGDLAKRKIIPALYRLFKNNELQNFKIMAVGRRPINSRQYLAMLEHKKFLPDTDQWVHFQKLITYIEHDITKPGLDKKIAANNTIFYLATPPGLYGQITEALRDSKLTDAPGWKRVVYEKPFGHDLRSAKKLNRIVSAVFNEEQIYRIDHYLGKELVQSMLAFRFANSLLRDIWNRKYVDHVQITLAETVGLGERGAYFDKAGATRDMVQNHMMQVLSLITMAQPLTLSADDIRDQKVKVLGKTKIQEYVKGQYKGYEKEVGKPGTTTDTYVALRAKIENNMWRGVPFYLRTGKALDKKLTEAKLVLKDITCHLFGQKESMVNVVTIKIHPDEGLNFGINAKKPGPKLKLDKVEMDFCYACKYGQGTPEAYEMLIHQVLVGDQTLFTRWDEVCASWKIVEPMLNKKVKIHKYAKGSQGPRTDHLLRGHKWH